MNGCEPLDVGKAVLERAGVKLKKTVKRSTAERNTAGAYTRSHFRST